MATQAAAGQAQQREQIPDSVLMYASIFTYEKPQVRKTVLAYRVNYSAIENYETSNSLSQGSSKAIREFVSLSNEDQRDFLDSPEKDAAVQTLFRALLNIVRVVSSDAELVRWALALINGIIEDSRVRVKFLHKIQKSYNADKKLDCISILNSYLQQNREGTDKRPERDMAAHTLAMLVSFAGIDKNQEEASNFLNYLLQQKDYPMLSRQAYTFCLMYLLKINQLAEEFVQKRGFHILQKLLLQECQEDAQIAYNVTCCFWILSYHKFALPLFQDFKLNVIEHVAKILDFSNKEKIVRMICRIFDNLKGDEICLEHLSMINALNLVIKLRNRPWVDDEIKKILERLFEYFDQNYQEFSSFDKWKAQVTRRSLTWSPVHTEKFWQTSFIYFNDAENLECINILIDILQQQPGNGIDNDALNQMKAVACYDIGEFARFFPLGKEFLEERETKEFLAKLMGDPNSSAELKKEAITAYQKMLMHSWGQHAN